MAPNVLNMMRKEVQVLTAFDHPHIVKLFEFAEDEKKGELVMILEYVAGGDCIDILGKNSRVLDEELVGKMVYQLLLALNHCHAEGIVHRDVKPENLMLSSEEKDGLECKLIDFGLATSYRSEVKEFAGTVSYLSPELAIEQTGFSTAADIWAVGAVTFELLTGVAPFGKLEAEDDGEQILEQIRVYESFDEDLLHQVFLNSQGNTRCLRSSEAKSFLRYLLVANPQDRPSASEALTHPFVARHAPSASALTEGILQKLIAYGDASDVTRGCLFAIAATGAEVPIEERLAGAFVRADYDGDGRISREDLVATLEDVSSRWWKSSRDEVSAESILRLSNLGDFGPLSYTDFVAACLALQVDCSDEELISRAFEVLDHDQDGMLKTADVLPLFRSLSLRSRFPKRLFLTKSEWQDCLLRTSEEDRGHQRQLHRLQQQLQQWQDDQDGMSDVSDDLSPVAEEDDLQKGSEESVFWGLLEGLFSGHCGPTDCNSRSEADLKKRASPHKVKPMNAFHAHADKSQFSAAENYLRNMETKRAAQRMAALAMASGPPDPKVPHELLKPIAPGTSFAGSEGMTSFSSLQTPFYFPPVKALGSSPVPASFSSLSTTSSGALPIRQSAPSYGGA
eukprot:TRINITY_DN95650_c0_g1_i1.p1 TRINITY_DN95650_c0_g1~~TRINITY_DN95650_c0_g1_i1.p1  ORF type:complete len:719 (+),score=148.81 TRINITY_DN95650_c0_g1_i1:289-2157(+)